MAIASVTVMMRDGPGDLTSVLSAYRRGGMTSLQGQSPCQKWSPVSLVLLGFLLIEVVSDAIAVRSWDAAFDGAQPAGYATTATRACSPHRDEVIVMMLDWNDYQRQLGTTIAQIGRISPDTIRGYRGLADAGSKSGVLDGKTRELIALAVSVTRQCDGCITIHTDAAIKQGATREEIVAALSVAITVNAGASLVYSARVMDAYTAKTSEAKS